MSAPPLHILLVDDDPAIQRLLRKWLESAGYLVTVAGDGREAQRLFADNSPQLVLTDWDMPQLDGLSLCAWLREQKTQNYIYTIFLTGRSASEDLIVALDTGADEFIRKPVNKGELLARVRSAARVLELERKLSVLAKTDPLTGLLSRRTFFETVEREWARAERHRLSLSCVMIDIDYFKRINDTHGHLAGDHALRSLATVLRQNCRGSDSIGRYGGEEFCVLLPETGELEAYNWADRVRGAIAAHACAFNDVEIQLTASFGVAQRTLEMHCPEDLMDHADQALLIAKRLGRDRVSTCQASQTAACPSDRPGDTRSLFGNLSAGQIASAAPRLDEDDSVQAASELLQQGHVTSVPVVDPGGRLVGVVSDRDILSSLRTEQDVHVPIREVMRDNVIRYEDETPVRVIYEFLCRVAVPAVFIVRDDQFVGTISRRDLLQRASHRASRLSEDEEFPLTQAEVSAPI